MCLVFILVKSSFYVQTITNGTFPIGSFSWFLEIYIVFLIIFPFMVVTVWSRAEFFRERQADLYEFEPTLWLILVDRVSFRTAKASYIDKPCFNPSHYKKVSKSYSYINGGYCIISMRDNSKLRVYKLTIALKKSMTEKNSKANKKSLLIKIEKLCSFTIFLNFKWMCGKNYLYNQKTARTALTVSPIK